MDALGISTVVIPTLPSQTSQAAAPILPKSTAPDLPLLKAPDQNFDAQVAEQKRLEAVHNAARDIANVYVVSDKTFTIFKDATGQYITRFTSLRDGRVTYIPEPSLLRMGNSGGASILSIKA